jgi:hypothetical protein
MEPFSIRFAKPIPATSATLYPRRAPSAANMTETEKNSANLGDTRDLASAEDLQLRAAWEKAWLSEYRCYTRYLALVAMDDARELDIQFAWLEWWDSTCVCREAARRLECSQGLHTVPCAAGRTLSETCEPRT